MLKRLVSALLCLCMVLTMCPVGYTETAEPKEAAEDPAAMEAAEETETEPVYEAGEPERSEIAQPDMPEEITEAETEPDEDEIQAFAQLPSDGVIDGGSLPGGLSWTLTEEGVLTVSGSGEMPHFAGDGQPAPWYEYRRRILCAMVEQGVTGIGDYAFYACDLLDTVWIGEDVESIGAHAFDGCAKLLSVQLPEQVRQVGSYAFFGCTELLSVSLPEGLTEIGAGAFEKCTGLKRMDLPGELERISDSLMKDCTALTDVTIPEGVGAIGSRAFSGCTALTGIVLPGSVTDLGGQGRAVFQDCGSLVEICIPEHVTAICPETFSGCASLTRIELPEELTSIGESAFAGCESLLSIRIPEGITQIPDSAFQNCVALKSVSLPENLIRIGNRAFYHCKKLNGIRIPDMVEGIGSCAFEGCEGLEGAALPAKITVIENNTFQGCTGLREIVLPANTVSIGDCAFMGCTALKRVELPAEAARIGASAFRDCQALGEVSFGQGLTEIGNHAFSGCGSLVALDLPENVTHIGSGAFESCESLERAAFPYGLKNIGDSAFYGCGALARISLPDSVTEIGAGAFESCEKLKRAALPQHLTGIKESLFENCGSLETITIPKTVTVIGGRAFFGCKALEDVSIPENVTSIGQAAFYGCGDFSMVDLSGLPQLLQEPINLTELVPLPESLNKATNGRAALVWELDTMPGETDCGTIAQIGQDNGKSVLEPISSGRFRLVCRDSFTGIRGSVILEARSNLEIRPAGEISLPSGGRIQLTVAALPGGEERRASWSLAAADGKAASVTADGCLTAKTVAEKVQVTVTAKLDSGGSLQKTVTILPRATAVGFLLNGKPIGKELDADMLEARSIRLSAVVQPEDALPQLHWGSDNEGVAIADDDGTVTLLKPGTAVIYAGCTDGSGVSGRVNLHVRYLDASESLTLTSPAQALEPGQTVQLTLTGENPIEAKYVSFAVSDEAKATVDVSGRLTAGETLGEVTVTAALKDDPLLRTAQVKLRIREGKVKDLRVVPDFPDDRGYEWEQNGQTLACIESGRLAGKPYTFHLTALGSRRADVWQAVGAVSYTSSNSALAAVSPDGTVTVKARAEGACVITACCQEEPQAQAEIRAWVRDSAPRLAAGIMTLNSYQEASVSTELVESYGNAVRGVSLHDYDRTTRRYLEEPSAILQAEYEDGCLLVRSLDVMRNGIYMTQLRVECENGSFTYPIQIRNVNVLPRVNVRQTERFDLFYLDSAVPVEVSVPGYQIERVELGDTDSFWLEWNEEEAGILRYAQDFVPGTRADTWGKLRIFLKGCRVPIERQFAIMAVNTVPRLTMDPAASVVNPNRDPASSVKVYWGSQVLDLTDAELTCTSAAGEVSARGENLVFRLTNARGGTVSFTLRKQNWAQPVKLSHGLLVDARLPNLRMKTGILRLNRLFPWQTDETTVWLTQNNQTLSTLRFVPVAREGTAQRTEAEKLTLSFDPENNTVRAGIRDGEQPKAGNYLFTCMGTLPDGTALPAANLSVTVGQTSPGVRLSAGFARMNRFLAGSETARIAVTTLDAAYKVVGFREIDGYEELHYANGVLTVRLTEDSRNTVFSLTPIVEDVKSGQCAALPSPLRLNLLVYNTANLSAALVSRGRLDTLTPESAITFTVTGMGGCLGPVEAISLEGTDAGKFRAEPELDGDRAAVKLTLLEGEPYDTRKIYQVRFRIYACGKEILSPVQWIRVSQSLLRVTAPNLLSYYLGQRTPVKCTLHLSAPAESIALGSRTDKSFLAALGDPGNMEIAGDQLFFHITDPGALRAGGLYTVYLEVTPENNAVNINPSQVRLTVRAMK